MDIKSYQDEVQAFVDRGNYHAAYNVALSGLNACHREHDQTGVDQCLRVIEGVIQQLVQEFGSKDYLE
jgi:hypothetical protein